MRKEKVTFSARHYLIGDWPPGHVITADMLRGRHIGSWQPYWMDRDRQTGTWCNHKQHLSRIVEITASVFGLRLFMERLVVVMEARPLPGESVLSYTARSKDY